MGVSSGSLWISPAESATGVGCDRVVAGDTALFIQGEINVRGLSESTVIHGMPQCRGQGSR